MAFSTNAAVGKAVAIFATIKLAIEVEVVDLLVLESDSGCVIDLLSIGNSLLALWEIFGLHWKNSRALRHWLITSLTPWDASSSFVFFDL